MVAVRRSKWDGRLSTCVGNGSYVKLVSLHTNFEQSPGYSWHYSCPVMEPCKIPHARRS